MIHFDEIIIYYLIEKTNFKLVVVAMEKNGQCKLCVVDSKANFKHTCNKMNNYELADSQLSRWQNKLCFRLSIYYVTMANLNF